MRFPILLCLILTLTAAADDAHLASISPVPLEDYVPVKIVFQDLSGHVIRVEDRQLNLVDLRRFLAYWGDAVRLNDATPDSVWIEISNFWTTLQEARPIYVTLFPTV